MIPLLPCFKVLPLVYDESLSYYELLCKLTNILRELANNIDTNNDTIKNEFKKVYQEINDLKEYVDKQDENLSNRIDLTNERITEEIRKCHEHCEIYAKRLYDQLLNILNQYQGEIKQWVLGEIAKIPTGIPKQFAITGNPETSGLQHDIITVTRESMCDFVNSDKFTCEQVDEIGIPIKFYEDNENFNANTCYDYDTKCFYSLYHNNVDNLQSDAPITFYFSISKVFKDDNDNELIIKGKNATVSVSFNGDKFIFEYDRINKILEIPISNLNIMIDLDGYIKLLDICKDQFFKFNFFNSDLPYGGYIGKITEINIIENNKFIQYDSFIPFLVD